MSLRAESWEKHEKAMSAANTTTQLDCWRMQFPRKSDSWVQHGSKQLAQTIPKQSTMVHPNWFHVRPPFCLYTWQQITGQVLHALRLSLDIVCPAATPQFGKHGVIRCAHHNHHNHHSPILPCFHVGSNMFKLKLLFAVRHVIKPPTIGHQGREPPHKSRLWICKRRSCNFAPYEVASMIKHDKNH